MANATFLLVGLLVLLGQGGVALLLGSGPLRPTLVLPMVLSMSVGDVSLARGVSLAFVLGYLTDACAGGSMGLWTFTLVSVFLLARAAGVKLFLHGVLFQVVLTFVASMVVGLQMLGLLLIFDRRPVAVGSALLDLGAQSLATAAFAPLVFAMVRRLPGATPSREESAGMAS